MLRLSVTCLAIVLMFILTSTVDTAKAHETMRAPICQRNADLVLGQSDFTSWGANRTPNCMLPDCANQPHANTISVDDGRFAFDSVGRVWISDKENSRVLRFDPPFSNGMNASVVLGQANFDTNTPSTGSRRIDADTLYGPLGLAFDSGIDGMRGTDDDRLWVVDRHNNRVLRFDPPFSTGMRASIVLGEPDFVSAGENYNGLIGRKEPVASGFDNPTDIAVDTAGNLWIVDTGNHRVLVYFAPIDQSGPSSGANDSADGVLGQPNFRSGQPNRGANTAVKNGFSSPRAISIDSQDNIWIVDNDNNRVVSYKTPIDMSGTIPGALDNGADLVLGQPNYTSNLLYRTGQHLPIRNGLGQPTGIAIDSTDDIWITDIGGSRVVRYDSPIDMTGPVPGANDNGADYLLGGIASEPSLTPELIPNVTSYTLGRPNGVGLDRDGNVWVIDHDYDRVLRFPCSG